MTSHDRQGGFATYACRIRTWLHREAYRLCGDWHEADDLVQMTLCRVFHRWEELERRDELTAYSYQTLLYVYLSERRRPRRRYEVPQAELPDHGDAPQPIMDRIVLTAAIRQLAPRQRAVITLRFCQDLTVEQTATVLGCSPGTVTSQTFRALNALRTTLASIGWS